MFLLGNKKTIFELSSLPLLSGALKEVNITLKAFLNTETVTIGHALSCSLSKQFCYT